MVGATTQHVFHSSLAGSELTGESNGLCFSERKAILVRLVEATCMDKLVTELGEDGSDGGQFRGITGIREQGRVQRHDPMRVTVRLAEHMLRPRADEVIASCCWGSWFPRSFEDKTELVVLFCARIVEEIDVDEFPRHQRPSKASGDQDREFLWCPAMNMN